MERSSTEHDDSTRHPPRRLYWVGGALLAIVIIGAGMWWLSWSLRLSSRLAQIRARGEPVTFAELDALYPRPTVDEDTTDLLLRAGKALQGATAQASVRHLPFIGEGPNPPSVGQTWPELEPSRQFLAANAEPVKLLHDAAARGGRARFDGVASDRAIDVIMEHAGALRTCARVLCLEANVCAHSGDADGAAEAISAGLILSRAQEYEPLLVSQLVRIAIFGVAAHELKRTLPVVDYSDEDLARFAEILQNIDFKTSLREALIGDRVFGLHMFDNLGTARGWKVPGLRSVFSADLGRYLDIMADCIATTNNPWPQLLAECDALANQVQANASRFNVLSSGTLPSVQATVNAMARAELTRRLVLTAVAIERFRRQHGHPPADLAALVPELLPAVPDDPTSGQPFTYTASDARYVLFSPTQRFPLPSGDKPDAETGANPNFVSRWPALPEPATDADAAQMDDEDAEEPPPATAPDAPR